MENPLSWEEKWEIIRKRGKKRYVVRQAFIWGTFMAIFMTGFLFFEDKVLNSIEVTLKQILIRFVISMLLFPIVGIYMGRIKWKRHEKHYQDWKQNQTS